MRALFGCLAYAFFQSYNIQIDAIMEVFTVGFIVLLVMTAILYIVLFAFIYYWHLIKITYIIVPIYFAFEYFAVGFLVVAIASFIIQNLPVVIRAAGI
jgi:hypothetical protein